MGSFLAFAAAFLAQDAEAALGPKTVQVQTATFRREPSAVKGLLRSAAYGEQVTVTAVERGFSKVTLADGATAWIASSALIARQSFRPAPSNEEEMMKLKAQGYEAGRFDPETEKKYREQKGPGLDAAYTQVDEMERRALHKMDRAGFEQALAAFRQRGKLGEFSDVR